MTTPWYKRTWVWLMDGASTMWTLSVALLLTVLVMLAAVAGVVLFVIVMLVYLAVMVVCGVLSIALESVGSMTAARKVT